MMVNPPVAVIWDGVVLIQYYTPPAPRWVVEIWQRDRRLGWITPEGELAPARGFYRSNAEPCTYPSREAVEYAVALYQLKHGGS